MQKDTIIGNVYFVDSPVFSSKSYWSASYALNEASVHLDIEFAGGSHSEGVFRVHPDRIITATVARQRSNLIYHLFSRHLWRMYSDTGASIGEVYQRGNQIKLVMLPTKDAFVLEMCEIECNYPQFSYHIDQAKRLISFTCSEYSYLYPLLFYFVLVGNRFFIATN